MSEKWTKGPWIVGSEHEPYDQGNYAWDEIGGVYHVGVPYSAEPIGGGDYHTAIGIQSLHDARLIAAAPELAEALEAILFQVIQGKVLERDACITQARAALAKARGCAEPKAKSGEG